MGVMVASDEGAFDFSKLDTGPKSAKPPEKARKEAPPPPPAPVDPREAELGDFFQRLSEGKAFPGEAQAAQFPPVENIPTAQAPPGEQSRRIREQKPAPGQNSAL